MAVLFYPQQYGDPIARVESRAVQEGRPILFDVELALLGAGEILGALEVLQDQPRSATWTASTDMTALVLKKHVFLSQFPRSTLKEIERVNTERHRQHQSRVARYIKARFFADVGVTTENDTKDIPMDDAATWIQQVAISRGNHSHSGVLANNHHSLSATGNAVDHYLVGHRTSSARAIDLSTPSSHGHGHHGSSLPMVTADVPHALDRLYTLTSPDANAAPPSRSIPARLADMFLDVKSDDHHHIQSGEPSLLAATNAHTLSSSKSSSSIIDDAPNGLAIELERIQASLLDDRPTASQSSMPPPLSKDDDAPLGDWQPMAPSSPPPPESSSSLSLPPQVSSSSLSSSVDSSASSSPVASPILQSSSASVSFASSLTSSTRTDVLAPSSVASSSMSSSIPMRSTPSKQLSSSMSLSSLGINPLTPSPARPQSAIQLRSSSSSRSLARVGSGNGNGNGVHRDASRDGRPASAASSSVMKDSSNDDKYNSPGFLKATANSQRRQSPTRVPPSSSSGSRPSSSLKGCSSLSPSSIASVAWSATSPSQSSQSPSQAPSSPNPSGAPLSLAEQQKKLAAAIPSPAALRDLRMTLTGNLSVDVRNLLDREARQAEEARAADRLARSVEAPSQRRTVPDRSLHVREKLARQDRLRQHNRESFTQLHHNNNNDPNHSHDHSDNQHNDDNPDHDHVTSPLPSPLPSPSPQPSSSQRRPASASRIPSATAERSKWRASRTAAASESSPPPSASLSRVPSMTASIGGHSPNNGNGNGAATSRPHRMSSTHSTVNTTIAPSGRPYGSLTKFALKLREKGRTKAAEPKDRVSKWEVDSFWRASW